MRSATLLNPPRLGAGPVDLGRSLSNVVCLNSQLSVKGQILENPEGEGERE